MKTRSKALLLSLCAVLLVAASVFGTMAYLTSTAEVKNTFSVGSVSITLDEADVDDSTPNDERDKANSYKLMPGHTYVKDPTVHVDANSEDCYLFVKVVDEITAIEGDKTVADQMTEKGWVAVEGVENVYIYTKTVEGEETSVKAAVPAGTNVVVFDNFTVKGDVENTTLAGYAGKTITVTAYAVQKDGFEDDTATDIWNATFGK